MNISTPRDEPTDADAEVEAPGELPNGGDLASLAAAMRAVRAPPIQAVPVNMVSPVSLV